MTEEDMNNITDQMMKELQPSIEKIHQRLSNIENTMSAQKEITHIGLKQIDNTILEETAIIRDRIREFKMMTTMKEVAAAHAGQEVPAAPETPEEEGVGATRNNMTKKEEEDIL
eukprot:10922928-Heterocapsa_arctica.AAC.1